MATVASAGKSYPITSAQGKDGHSQVFFVNEDNTISYWVSREEPEKFTQARRYEDDYLKNGDKYITTTSKDLDAVSYLYKDVDYTRLYFADEKSILRELCLDTPKGKDSGSWFYGLLGNANIKVKQGSPISAHVNLGKTPGKDVPQLKVYFFAENADRPSIVSHVIGQDKWQTKTI